MAKNQFESEWESLKNRYEGDHFYYTDASKSAKDIITDHFSKKQQPEKYGVYVIRKKESKNDEDNALYIGKAGTVMQNGSFKKQGIPQRLKRPHFGDDKWLSRFVEKHGPLVIEYVFLRAKPRSPTFVEAVLLQKYLSDHGHLPRYNTEF